MAPNTGKTEKSRDVLSIGLRLKRQKQIFYKNKINKPIQRKY